MKPKDLTDNIVEITLPKSSTGKDGTEKEILSESFTDQKLSLLSIKHGETGMTFLNTLYMI